MANDDFINYIWPHAVAASEATGVDPRIIAGQAAVESGWGQHFVGNNLFGIKGPGVNALTREVGPNGAYQTSASFRSYPTPADSVAGYADFINQNPRYAAFKQAGDVGAQLTALQRSGYATDPNYAGAVANAAAAIDGVVRKKDAANWSGKPGTPTDIKTALGYTGEPEAPKAAPVSDTGSDFFKDMGIDPNAKKEAAPASTEGQGSDFFKDMGITPPGVKPAAEPPQQRAAGGASSAIPAGDASAAIGGGIMEGVPIAGPYIKEGALRSAAAIRSLQNNTPFQTELENVRNWDKGLQQEHPDATTAGQIGGSLAAFGGASALPGAAVALGMRAPAAISATPGLMPAIGRLAAQGVVGGGTNALIGGTDAYVRGENPLTGAALGGAAGAAAPAVGAVAAPIARGAMAAFEPFSAGGREAIADRVIGKFALGGPTMANDNALIAGSVPTLAQATANPGIATLERGVRDVRPNPFVERTQANAAAREEAFGALKGDAHSLDNLIAARQASADPLREAAFSDAGKADPSGVVKTINEILSSPAGQRDAVVKALGDVKRKIVQGGGEAADPMAAITGAEAKPPKFETNAEQLYGIRQAIGDKLSPLAARTGSDAQLASKELMQVKSELDKAIEGAAPGFKEYLANFAEGSKPIDTQRYLQGLNLTNVNGQITLGNVDRAIKSIEKARAQGGVNEAKSIPGDVIDKLTALRDDLRREGNSSLGKSLGSNTFQNLATNNIASQAGVPLAGLGFLAHNPLVGTAMYGMNKAYQSKNEAIMDALVNKLLTPQLPNSGAFARLQGGQNLNVAPWLVPSLVGPNRNRLVNP